MWRPCTLAISVAVISHLWGVSAHAQEPPEPPFRALGSLKGLEPPLPNLGPYVRDREAAIVLGKALFFETRVGNDGQSCANCHFRAGADPRLKNQFSPGLNDTRFLNGDTEFGGLVNAPGLENGDGAPAGKLGKRASGRRADSNVKVIPGDFPLHKLKDPDDRNSRILYTTNDVFSSQGTFDGGFISAQPNEPAGPLLPFDGDCFDADASIFHAGAFPARKVEPLHTPTTINSAFFFRLFFNGRANNRFNGAGVFGDRNEDATLLVWRNSANALVEERVSLKNAATASQAAGPPLSSFEMSCEGREFAHVARKVLGLRPLVLARVHPNDSVLGPYRHPSGRGLTSPYGRYKALVRKAFRGNLWKVTGLLPSGYTQMETNFAFFWSVSIMLYESTLISDDSPFDRFCGANPCDPEGSGDPDALTDQEKLGLAVFTGSRTSEGVTDGKCVNCHDGPEFSKAATHLQGENQEEGLVERMIMGDGGVALYDNGFYNIGVTPTVEDLGVGGTDPFGNPLSFTRQYLDILRGEDPPDPFQVDPCTFEVPFDAGDCSVEPSGAAIDDLRVAVDGAFKVPILRIVGLTSPFFHNGSAATLMQVVDFYNRGGNRRGQDGDDTTGSGPLGQGGENVSDTPIPTASGTRGSNLDPDIQPLGLTDEEKEALVAFMLALTDERVACEMAPFDHPSLKVPNGQRNRDTNKADGRADDAVLSIPAVGAGGLPALGRACLKNSGNLFDQ